MKYCYFGQWSFANRGCEALIRSITKIIRDEDPSIDFVCPSEDASLDSEQWPEAQANGIEFVQAIPFAKRFRYINRIERVFPLAGRLRAIPLRLHKSTKTSLAGVGAVILTGGDIVSLDYGVSSLYFWTGITDAARRRGLNTPLVAGSVGPFPAGSALEKDIAVRLKRFTSLSVREAASFEYLKELGIPGVRLVADPAFLLEPEPVDVPARLRSGQRTVGVNFSTLIRDALPDDGSREKVDESLAGLIRSIVEDYDYDVLLIPHVDGLGDSCERDRRYLTSIQSHVQNLGERVWMSPDGLNTSQLKYIIGKCNFMVAARTHATIASLSQGIPTLSIGYSRKAVALNRDLFGHTDYLIRATDATIEGLSQCFLRIHADEKLIRARLGLIDPELKRNARQIVSVINGTAPHVLPLLISENLEHRDTYPGDAPRLAVRSRQVRDTR